MSPVIRAATLFSLDHSLCGPALAAAEHPWDILANLRDLIYELAGRLPAGYREVGEGIWVGPDVVLAPTAVLQGPAIIGAGCRVRHAAFLRENVVLGDGCVVGNSTEVKNAVLFDGVQVPHFNYVGDSILGHRAHLGAGAVLSNVRLDRRPVKLHGPGGEVVETGLAKLGALLGDRVEIGCHAVVNPGSVVGRDTLVYPLTNVRGFIPPKSILKADGNLAPRRD